MMSVSVADSFERLGGRFCFHLQGRPEPSLHTERMVLIL